MNLPIQKTPEYHTDVTRQFGWYADKGDEELAWQFFDATDQTLEKLSCRPDLGRRRKFRHPMLRELRSFPVERPFQKILIFYRVTEDALQAWRLMHGARDLSRRLVER